MVSSPRIGVLALQGDFAEHLSVLEACGCEAFRVRTPLDLDGASALVVPGGESTTMLKLIDRADLRDPLRKRIVSGMPVFGTCAGAIVLADKVSDGEPPLGVLPAEIERNALGRQIDSFETDIAVPRLAATLRAVFIRAPVIRSARPDVEVLAELDGKPVLLQSGNILVSTFHTEIAAESRLHRYFVEQVCAEAGG